MKTLRAVATLVASLGLLLGSSSFAASNGISATNWFGGPVYDGEPALEVTAALVKAGGGADNFDFSTALVSMLGEKTVNSEVAKLQEQYDEQAVSDFVNGMTFAVNDGLKRASKAGVALPAAPSDLKGTKLAEALVSAGIAPDGTWYSGYLFDKALSHKLHNQVMADIEAKYSHAYDENAHRLLNQAMYDVAQALGHGEVKLAPLH